MTARSVLLAAVHYGELSESPAQHVVQKLVDSELVQDVIYVVEQPLLSDTANIVELSSWRHDQRVLESCWRQHLGKRNALRELAGSLNQGLYRLQLRLSVNFQSRQWRTRQIEKFVTAKHIQAWRQFVQSPHTELVVIESDATLTSESVDRVSMALVQAAREQPTYVNLAGGFTQKDLAIQSLALGIRDGMTVFSLPVTNTSCAYAINRSLAIGLLSFLGESPECSALGIDWLLNAFFVAYTERGEEIYCLHANPPALQHGSLTGVTRSWHPDR